MLGALRMLPEVVGHLLHGERPAKPPDSMRLRDLFAQIGSAAEFREFDEPGFAKTVYDLSARELDLSRTLLTGLMRTATTDEHECSMGRSGWVGTVVSAGGHRT